MVGAPKCSIQCVQAHYCRTWGWVQGSVGKNYTAWEAASVVPGETWKQHLKNLLESILIPINDLRQADYLEIGCIGRESKNSRGQTVPYLYFDHNAIS